MCNCDDHDHGNKKLSRRQALTTGLAGTAAMAATTLAGTAQAQDANNPYAEPAEPGLPASDMKLDLSRAALVVTDPQNDFLSPDGVTWGVIGPNATELNTVENIETLFRTAKDHDITTAVSPHYYYPTDHGWKFEGALEKLMHQIGCSTAKVPWMWTVSKAPAPIGWSVTNRTSMTAKPSSHHLTRCMAMIPTI